MELAVKHSDQREIVRCVVLGSIQYPRFVRTWVASSRKTAHQQRGESFVACLVCDRLQFVERKHGSDALRRLASTDVAPPHRQADIVSDSLCKPFRGFEYGMEIVDLHQLYGAILQHFGMHMRAAELCPDRPYPPFCFVQCLGSRHSCKLAIPLEFQTRECQHFIDRVPAFREELLPSDLSTGRK